MIKRCNCTRLVFLVLLAWMGAAPVPAASTTFGDIEISAPPVPKGTVWHGYYEYVFVVTNHSKDRAHTVSLSLPFEERRHVVDDSLRELSRTVQVGAAETVRVSLLQPDFPPIEGMNLAVRIDGQKQEREVPVATALMQHRIPGLSYGRGGSASMGSGMSEPLILTSKRIRVEDLPRSNMPVFGPRGELIGGAPGRTGAAPPGAFMPEPPRGKMSPRPARPPIGPAPGIPQQLPAKAGFPAMGIQFENAEEVESWSADWLAYSRYDGIILSRDDFTTIQPGVQTALWRYVETGGTLLVMGQTELPGLSTPVHKSKDKAGWTMMQVGFGQCFVSPDANYHEWDQEHFNKLAGAWLGMVQSWQVERNTRSANKEFPVISDLGIPAKSLFTIMFLFTLAIGPANYLMLIRLKRRIWLLWTVPVISFLTCLAVFGFMLLSEGWSGQLRTETLTLLDETTHRATTMGWTGVYCPLTPSDGLHFSYETEVIAQRMGEGWNSSSRACTLEWSRDQHLASGWVEARVPALFKVRKSETRRERVTFDPEPDGRWSMVNKLGVPISRILYADAAGAIHEATNIAPGAPARLEPKNQQIPVSPAVLPRSVLLGSNWMAAMQAFARDGERHLLANTYLAEVEGSPFLEDALTNAKSGGRHALVMGFCPAENPSRDR